MQAQRFAEGQAATIEDKAKKVIAKRSYAPELGVETEDYIRKKYGFDLKENSKGKAAADRAEELHLKLMEGNRKNCFRNYLYFTQRFSFTEPDKVISGQEPYRRLEAKASELFGSGKTYGGYSTLPEYEEQELARLGERELKRFKKDYPGHEKLNEDDILKMLEPAFNSVLGSSQEIRNVRNSKQTTLDNDSDRAHLREVKVRAEMKIRSGQVDAAFAKVKSSEVGFIVYTKAFQDQLERFGSMSLDDRRKMIRSAVQENVEATQKYANWITSQRLEAVARRFA
jgi:hypothetical protein